MVDFEIPFTMQAVIFNYKPNLRYFTFVTQLVVMIGVRKSLDFIFTKHELRALDDLMPDSHHKEPKDDEEVKKNYFETNC